MSAEVREVIIPCLEDIFNSLHAEMVCSLPFINAEINALLAK